MTETQSASTTQTHSISVTVNGTRRQAVIEARRSLADLLRDDFGLTGTHLGCEHGICGACTVLLDGQPVRSCLVFGVQADGHEVRTVEGLADEGDLTDLQQAFSQHRALQCGYCSPGFMMLFQGYLATDPEADPEEIRDVVSSNLCRCTGYQNIIDAVTEVCRTRKASRDDKSIY
jgi:aerobic-type carbon monoxide dehydrogenase small subunit (CoxS/CutS family)